jgi:tetratricopeptide (TPR) repeat protein
MSANAAAFLTAARNAVLNALRQQDLVTATLALERLSTLRDCEQGTGAQQAKAQAELGDLWSLLHDYARARVYYDRAIALSPAQSRYWFNRAAVQRYLGELSAAENDYDQTLRLAPEDAQAYLHRSELRVQSAQRNHLAELERVLSMARGWQSEVPLRYALAKEYEDLGDYAHAWRHLAAGAALRRQHLQYTARVDLDTADWISSAYPASVTFSGGCDSEEPIFIVGMPRTGSTLVDRILSTHSEVFSAGELPDFSAAVVAAVQRLLGRAAPRQEFIAASSGLDFTALGEDYLRRTRPRTGKTPRFTDKLPINYLYAGLIARAFPNARIVHVTRDPVANCYGIFKVLFQQGYPFSYDLIELADYYGAYHRLMQHWRRALPGRIIDFSYEDLVSNAPVEVPQLLHAVGLSWQSACLESHKNPAPVATASAAQVRRPIYSSALTLWRHYEHELQPLIARLKAAGVPMQDP